MNFILLTEYRSSGYNLIHVNKHHITFFKQQSKPESSVLRTMIMLNNGECIYVLESPEDIVKELNKE